MTNVLPAAAVLGVMGAAGIALSTGTVMVASVVIGVAVDDTLHYSWRYRRERASGAEAAVRAATSSTGVALTVTTAVLVLGLWVGALGSFMPTVYFSLLSGVAMIVALLCDLTVLPASLLLLDGRRGVPGSAR